MPQIMCDMDDNSSVDLGNGIKGNLNFFNSNMGFTVVNKEGQAYQRSVLTFSDDPIVLLNGKNKSSLQRANWDSSVYYLVEKVNDNLTMLHLFDSDRRTIESISIIGPYYRIHEMTSRCSGIVDYNDELYPFDLNERNEILFDDDKLPYCCNTYHIKMGEEVVKMSFNPNGSIVRWINDQFPLDFAALHNKAEFFHFCNTNAILRLPFNNDDRRLLSIIFFDASGSHEVPLSSLFPEFNCFKVKSTTVFNLLEFDREKKIMKILMQYQLKSRSSRVILCTASSCTFSSSEVNSQAVLTNIPFSYHFTSLHSNVYELRSGNLLDLGCFAWHCAQYPRVPDLNVIFFAYNKTVSYKTPSGILVMDFENETAMHIPKEISNSPSERLHSKISDNNELSVFHNFLMYQIDVRKDIKDVFTRCVLEDQCKCRSWVGEHHVVYLDRAYRWRMIDIRTNIVENITEESLLGDIYFSSRDKLIFTCENLLVTVTRDENGIWTQEEKEYEDLEGDEWFTPNIYNDRFYFDNENGKLCDTQSEKTADIESAIYNFSTFIDSHTIVCPDGIYGYTDDLELTKLFDLDCNLSTFIDNVYRVYTFNPDTTAIEITSFKKTDGWVRFVESFDVSQFFQTAKFVQTTYNPFTEEGERFYVKLKHIM
ncbi:hypothetical protein PCE1_003332 [Barthelona sp. PCE]